MARRRIRSGKGLSTTLAASAAIGSVIAAVVQEARAAIKTVSTMAASGATAVQSVYDHLTTEDASSILTELSEYLCIDAITGAVIRIGNGISKALVGVTAAGIAVTQTILSHLLAENGDPILAENGTYLSVG